MKIVNHICSILLCGLLVAGTAGGLAGLPSRVSAEEAGAAVSDIEQSASSSIQQIAGGKGFTVVLKQDGTVWTLGDNLRGKLGGGLQSRKQAVKVSGLSDVTAIAAGQSHTLALKKDGTVWAWGENTYGQLGNGTIIDQNTPVQVKGLSHVVSISAGIFHSVALKDDGTVWTWGDNTYGQLGDSTMDAKNEPVQIKGNLAGVKAIASGAYHNLAIDNDGIVWAWGDNYFGELGYGYDQNRLNTPIMVTTGSSWKITQIAAGLDFSLAVKDDGTLLYWGLMSSRQNVIGNSNGINVNYSEQKLPLLVNGVEDITQIAAGGSYAAALTKDGSVYTWGENSYGQLGIGLGYDGATWDRSFPAKVNGLPAVSSIGTGPNFMFAVDTDGQLWSWGSNSYGQLGDGTNNNQPSPVESSIVKSLEATVKKPGEGNKLIKNPKAVSLAAGGSDTFAIRPNGVFGWGVNTYGQLGIGSNLSAQSPKQLELGDVSAISSGNAHTLAVKNDGTLWSWGQNYFGQLGSTGLDNQSMPVQVSTLTDVVSAFAGNNHSIALLANGTVWTFGDNTYGQLGHDSDPLPAAVPSLSNIVAVSAGANFNLALENSGTIWAWGDNTNGQLGDGTFASKQQPVPITGVTGVIAISAGKNHALALKSDGSVWAWGYNAFGQLGDGTTTSSNKPVRVTKLNQAAAIQAGAYHSMAIGKDGSVWSWGQNLFGQLGDGTLNNRNQPVQVKDMANVSQMAAGTDHSAVMLKNGSIWTWGGNSSGQLGDGTLTNRSEPALVPGLTDTYNDISGHWAETAIEEAAAKGYINGYDDGSFKPDHTITRAEFVKMLMTGLRENVQPASDEVWYKPYVEAAQRLGLLQEGDLQGEMNEPITRQELAILSLRAATSKLSKPYMPITSKDAMNDAVQNGIMEGLADGELAPTGESTRAQAVIVLKRTLDWKYKVANTVPAPY
ncbi:RCC1 domain-containing protein [Paenibacillus hexagrammi]|uniref:S-layer homology domain-containing protein n=1 Tax=Paenibacillus hexagrammi TaxID=2908839 RepID=A0ABY3SDX9_9BACL|nr:S-layer homology domain-containing protein [Paenibacillus sp. YPD9-1]UJF31315.1 S-layer homology domain-containing protein [Paenibacillus sp. YPD9-1]